jgi:hypothetical protein
MHPVDHQTIDGTVDVRTDQHHAGHDGTLKVAFPERGRTQVHILEVSAGQVLSLEVHRAGNLPTVSLVNRSCSPRRY